MNDLSRKYSATSNILKRKGWVVIKKFFLTKEVQNIKKDIIKKIKKTKNNKNFYYESINKKEKLRRIEKVADFSRTARILINSKKVLELISYIKNNSFLLFKDKLNFKYPGGKGYLPHIDGHFLWRDKYNKKQNGWKKYSNDFINLVVPLEETNKKNGCIYIADIKNTFDIGKNFSQISKKLILGTPNINKKYIKKFKFNSIELSVGDICLFDWRCAHFSKDNKSKKSRMIFYATYCKKNKLNNVRSNYYYDKQTSLNDKRNKSLLFS